ncbi:MAG: flagellar biosynthetic protein FliQ [Sporichthyaceae bacterium]
MTSPQISYALTDTEVVSIGLQAMIVGAKLCAPILLTALAIGFAISLFQSVTMIQEVTLSFVPKIIGVGVALLISGNWMLATMITFTESLFAQLPELLGSG